MERIESNGLSNASKLLGMAAAGLTLAFAAQQANISGVNMRLSIASFSLAIIASIVCLTIEGISWISTIRRRMYEDDRRRQAILYGDRPENIEEDRLSPADRFIAGAMADHLSFALALLLIGLLLIALIGSIGFWWRASLVLGAAGIAAYWLYSDRTSPLVPTIYAAACAAAFLFFCFGVLNPITSWAREAVDPGPMREAHTLFDNYEGARARKDDVEIKRLRAEIELLIRKGRQGGSQCPGSTAPIISLKGEKGDRGDRGEKGDKGDRGERGDPGVPGTCGS